MKILFLIVVTLFCGCYWYSAVKDMQNEKVWIKQYNKLYSVKNPDKVYIVNDYYYCLASKKSVIEGCEVHVAKTKVDTVAINEYLNGLKQYVEKKKND